LQHEMMVLLSIVENREGPGSSVRHWTVNEELERLGYNNLALNIGLEGLLEKEMISCSEDADYNHNVYREYLITGDGMKWIRCNYERLNLKSAPPIGKGRKNLTDLDYDVPF
jgi:hypothetical protein